MLGLSFALSFVKIPLGTFGGSVTLFSMVPVVIIGAVFGLKRGLLAAFCYSILQLLQSIAFSNSFVLDSWWKTALMIVLDFLCAFTALGLGGIFSDKNGLSPGKSAAGGAVAVSVRYICHILSGWILWGTYAEWYFSDAESEFLATEATASIGRSICESFSGEGLALIYSIIYNGLYMIPEIIMTAAGVFIILKNKHIRAGLEKLR